MKKAKLTLTALMIGTLTVTGASFAEAGVELDDVKIGIHFKNDHKTSAPDRHEAPKPSEAHRHDEHRGPHDVPQHPMPIRDHGSQHRPHGPEYHHHGHNVPPHHGHHHGGHR